MAVPTTTASAIRAVKPTNPSNGQIGGLASFPVCVMGYALRCTRRCKSFKAL